jgi:hypothetical protein
MPMIDLQATGSVGAFPPSALSPDPVENLFQAIEYTIPGNLFGQHWVAGCQCPDEFLMAFD